MARKVTVYVLNSGCKEVRFTDTCAVGDYIGFTDGFIRWYRDCNTTRLYKAYCVLPGEFMELEEEA